MGGKKRTLRKKKVILANTKELPKRKVGTKKKKGGRYWAVCSCKYVGMKEPKRSRTNTLKKAKFS